MTNWYSCTYNAKEGSRVIDYLKKGTKIFAEGRVYAYNKDDEARLALYIHKIELLNSGRGVESDEVPF